jgi:hypothetical protein
MLHFILLFLGLVSSAPANSSYESAEYVRLHSEMQMLAEREAWAGVEKSFIACKRLGVELSRQDYLLGAYSAEAQGNVAQTRDRLWAAHQLKEDPMVIDWLWSIDSTYARANLKADPEDELTYIGDVFDPRMPKILDHARKLIGTGVGFDGYLLPGSYTLGEVHFKVVLGGAIVQANTRTVPKRKRRFVQR